MRFINFALAILFWCGSLSLHAQWREIEVEVETTLRDIHFAPDLRHGALVGNDGTVLLTGDGGKRWLPIETNFKEDFHSVRLLSPDTILLAGGTRFDGQVYRSTDGGQSWDLVAEGYRMAWADEQGFALNNQTILRSQERGAEWQESNLVIPSPVTIEALWFPSPNTGFAVGNISGFAGQAPFGYRSGDGGNNWQSLRESDFPNSNLVTAGAFPHPDTAYVTLNETVDFAPGPVNQLMRMTDFQVDANGGFPQWQFEAEIIRDTLPTYVRALHFLNAQRGYLAGDDGIIYYTEDGGRSWDNRFTATDTIETFYFLSPNTGFALGRNGALLAIGNLETSTSTEPSPIPLEVKVYPNPASDFLRIRLAESAIAQVALYTVSGHLVRQTEIRRTGQLNLRSLREGWYLLVTQIGQRRSSRRVLVKERK